MESNNLKKELINTILKYTDGESFPKYDRKQLESLDIEILDKIISDYYFFEIKDKMKEKN
jgi:hypothetical protein